MWLIDTTTLDLIHFMRCPSNEYAILSHTWEDDEVSFGEYHPIRSRLHKGFWKIRQCCQQAKKDGLQYAWVDTCCIDQKSSAELSEAINSMFNWYLSAKVCYAYLADVAPSFGDDVSKADLLKSRWFKRGWTLQELLAPSSIIFYDSGWLPLGSKADLVAQIVQATGIDRRVLTGEKAIDEFSIAQRMSWASSRATTRVEDIAYSLLGIFDVNMPLLYGEGSKAFMRLQEMIIQRTNDETIFAWTGVSPGGSGLLASSPAKFAGSHNTVCDTRFQARNPFSMTNRGIAIDCKLVPCAMNTYSTLLLCHRTTNEEALIQIFIGRTMDDSQYRRVSNGDSDIREYFDSNPWNYFRGQRVSLYIPHGSQLNSLSRSKLLVLRVTWKRPSLRTSGNSIHDQRAIVVGPPGLAILQDNECERTAIVMMADDFKDSISLVPGASDSVVVADLETGLSIEPSREIITRFPFQRLRVGFDVGFRPIFFLATDKCTHEELEKFERTSLWDYKASSGVYQRAYGLIGTSRVLIDEIGDLDPDYVELDLVDAPKFLTFTGHRLHGLCIKFTHRSGVNLSLGTLSIYPCRSNSIEGTAQWHVRLEEDLSNEMR